MLHLRVAEPRDAEGILAIYAPYVRDTAITFEFDTPSLSEITERIRNTLSGYPYLVCVQGDRVLGYAYAHKHKEREAYKWNVEFSVYIDGQSTGKGMGKALYHALVGISRMQNVQNVYAGITVPNEKSERLHAAFGFQEAGLHCNTGYKQGQWYDVQWYHLRIGDYVNPPPPMIPFPQLDMREVQAMLREAEALYMQPIQ